MAYAVSQRTRELGIRISIGARTGDVLRLVLGQGFALGVIGMVVAVVAALAVTRFSAHLLYGVSAADPITFSATSVLLLGVALAASYFPARRATKVDPITALRSNELRSGQRGKPRNRRVSAAACWLNCIRI